MVKRPRGVVDVFECKVNPDSFDPEVLRVLRSQYPSGKNFVTGPTVDVSYERRYGNLVVTCGTPADLLRADGPRPRASGASRAV